MTETVCNWCGDPAKGNVFINGKRYCYDPNEGNNCADRAIQALRKVRSYGNGKTG